jgi:cytochrome c oxidase subunit II
MLWDVLFNARSPQAQAMSTLFTWFLVLAATIFVIVTGLVVYGLIRYRARAGTGEPRQTFGSRKWETTWTVIPLLIVVVLFIFTIRTMAFVDAPQDANQSPDLVISAHQWWWEARYSNGAVVANEIHVPVSKRLLARIESDDVIHDFWTPQLARKMDAVPGRPSYIWLEADVPGTYQGACSEFCGMQHAGMRFLVVAEPEDAFNTWLQHAAETNPEAAGGAAAEGARLFREKKCADCHAIDGTAPRTKKGPTLAHVASRRLLGGQLSNTPQNLIRWTTNPQSIKPGNHMPDQPMSSADAQALGAYLETRQ